MREKILQEKVQKKLFTDFKLRINNFFRNGQRWTAKSTLFYNLTDFWANNHK